MRFSARQLLYPANLLSLLRLLLAVPVTYLVARPELHRDHLLIVLIGVAILTDLLDGYAGRKLNQVSDLGKVLDPFADKVIIGAGIIAAVLVRGFPALLVLLLAYRDLLILAGGVMVTKRLGRITMANRWGKLNTFFVSFYCLFYTIDSAMLVTRLFGYAALVAIVVSGVSYYRFGEPYLFRTTGARWGFRVLFLSLPVLLALGLDKLAPHLTWI